jgi:hypothetical protein
VTLPAVPFRTHEHVTPATPGAVPGVGGLIALVSVGEGTTAEAPPVAPLLAASLTHEGHVRRVMSASGMAITSALRSGARLRYSVRWPSMTQDERSAMHVWLAEVVQFTRFAWPLAVDGSDEPTTPVRFLEVAAIEELGNRVYQGLTVEVEQVL